jgi:hypothetical protein
MTSPQRHGGAPARDWLPGTRAGSRTRFSPGPADTLTGRLEDHLASSRSPIKTTRGDSDRRRGDMEGARRALVELRQDL